MMKNDLTCAVVRDLLPSYVEGLTSVETSRAVEAHLTACADCTARKNAMTEPEEPVEQEKTVKEVDYLKKVKRRRWKWATGAVLCTLALVAAGFAAKVFLIGTPAQEQDLWISTCNVMDETLYFTVTTHDSAAAFFDWEVEKDDAGVVRIWGRRVLASPLHRESIGRLKVPLEGVQEIYLCGRLIWQDGLMLEQDTLDLYETKTPYMGDAPALERVANALGIHSKLGNYTNSLHNSSRPYDWTLEFSTPMMEGRIDRMNFRMKDRAVIMLALVENLDQVTWTYTDTAGVFHSQTVTTEDAISLLREQFSIFTDDEAASYGLLLLDDIKDYAATPADFQRLLNTICYDPINN